LGDFVKLHLGVAEIPYEDGKTTGDVAEYLENKYHPMEIFWQLHGQEVADDMAGGLAGSLESLMMGAPPTHDPFGTAMSRTEERFKSMISSGELERLGYPGLPTEAAKKRRSLRFKAKKKSGPRPSLVDTGLYQASFKSWVDK
jgi:hypothetical protein